VFISHTNSPEDIEVVEQVGAELGSVGVMAYVAEKDRQLGNYLTEKIKANIMNSDLVIGIWTKSAAGSTYVSNELGFAEDKKPWYLLVEKGAKVKGFAEGREYLEFDRANLSEALMQLVDDVRKRAEDKQTLGTIAIVAVGVLTTILAVFAAAYLAKGKE